MLGLHMQLESCNPNPFCTWLERAQGCLAGLLSVVFPREGASNRLLDSLQPECEQVSSGAKPSCPWVSRRPGTRTAGDSLPEHTAWRWRPSHWGAAGAQAYWLALWRNILSKLIVVKRRCPFDQQNSSTARQCSWKCVGSSRNSSAPQPSWRSSEWLQHVLCTMGEARVTARTALVDLDCRLSSGSVWVVRLMQVTVWSALPCLQLNCTVLVRDMVLSVCEICLSPAHQAFCAEGPGLAPISKFPSTTEQSIWGKHFCMCVCRNGRWGLLHIRPPQHHSHTQPDAHSTDGAWKHTGKKTKINHPL